MEIRINDLKEIRAVMQSVLNHPKSFLVKDDDAVRFPMKVRAVKILIFTLEQVIEQHSKRRGTDAQRN